MARLLFLFVYIFQNHLSFLCFASSLKENFEKTQNIEVRFILNPLCKERPLLQAIIPSNRDSNGLITWTLLNYTNTPLNRETRRLTRLDGIEVVNVVELNSCRHNDKHVIIQTLFQSSNRYFNKATDIHIFLLDIKDSLTSFGVDAWDSPLLRHVGKKVAVHIRTQDENNFGMDIYKLCYFCSNSEVSFVQGNLKFHLSKVVF